MTSSESISVSTRLPVTVNPSDTEIVFNSDTNSYSLSLGVKIQLPITELVEVLLKFNQEQVASHSSTVEELLSSSKLSAHDIGGLLATLPEPTSLDAAPEPPPGLGDGSSGVYTPNSRGADPAHDDFARISVTVARQEPALLEYRERAKWTSGKYVTTNAKVRSEANASKLTTGFELFGELPVHAHFLSQADYCTDYPTQHYHPRSGSMDSTLSSYSMKPPPTSLSADAPVFTPGSAFASTAQPSLDSLRIRAMSDTFVSHADNLAGAGRNERAMSLAYLPPSALSVMREEGAGCSTENDWAAPEMQRGESRPAECKQM